jgi:hypothetical protein
LTVRGQAKLPDVTVTRLDVSADPTGHYLMTVDEPGGYTWWSCHPAG